MKTLQLYPSTSKGARGGLSPVGILTALMLFLGFAGSFLTRFVGSADPLSSMAAGAALILLLPLLCRTRFGGQIAFAILCASFAASLFFLDLTGGLCAVLNLISDAIGARLAYALPRFSASDAALLPALIWLALLLALACLYLVRARAALAAWLIALTLLLPEFLLGMTAPDVWVAVLTCGLIMLRFPIEVQRGHTWRGLTAGLCVLLAFALAFGLSCLPSISTPAPVAAAHERIATAVQRWRFGSSSETGLPNGDLAHLGNLRRTNAPMLEISMSRSESLYLRGYVGSEYAGSAWRATDPEALWDGAELFYWLHRGDFYGETQLAALAALVGNADEAPIEIHIAHTGARRDIIYTPYELISASDDLPDLNDVGDVRLRKLTARGLEDYTLVASENQVRRYAALSRALSEKEAAGADDALNAYLNNESHYNRFVYAHFLNMPEDMRVLMTELFGAYAHDENEHMDYAHAKQRVLDWLNENVTYSESTSPLAADTDFLTDFLLQSRAGYDVHYAAAATMMMRYFGIPARYVEGYLITPDTAANVQPNTPFTLSEADAHAWTEIYQDGVGWIPFETAPGYLNLMPQQDLLSGTGEAQEQPQLQAQDDTPLPENSLDMTEDFHEDPDDQDASQPETDLSLLWLLLLCLAASLLLICLILVLLLGISRARRRRQFRAGDRRAAVLSLYAYLFELMQRIYNWPDCVAPSGFERTVYADMGADMAAKYTRALDVCRRAAFSGDAVTEQDYAFVYSFVMKTRKLAKKRLPLRGRWKL